VAVDDLEVRPGLVIPGDEIRTQVSRSSGPGGQNVNKTNTRVTLRFNPAGSRAFDDRVRQRVCTRLRTRLTRSGDLVVHADRARSQARNLEAARRRLAELIAGALARERPRTPTRPTASAKRRRLDTKKRRAHLKQQRGPVRED
jgi:ribosome-associated protein